MEAAKLAGAQDKAGQDSKIEQSGEGEINAVVEGKKADGKEAAAALEAGAGIAKTEANAEIAGEERKASDPDQEGDKRAWAVVSNEQPVAREGGGGREGKEEGKVERERESESTNPTVQEGTKGGVEEGEEEAEEEPAPVKKKKSKKKFFDNWHRYDGEAEPWQEHGLVRKVQGKGSRVRSIGGEMVTVMGYRSFLNESKGQWLAYEQEQKEKAKAKLRFPESQYRTNTLDPNTFKPIADRKAELMRRLQREYAKKNKFDEEPNSDSDDD
jgi:hypothetical protein